jgi:hypothetical protein
MTISSSTTRTSSSGTTQTSFAAVFGIGLHLDDPVERAGQIGHLCGIAAAQLGSSHPIVLLLREAERGDGKALAQALAALAALPALMRRRLIATFATLQWLRRVAKPRRKPGLEGRQQ